MKRKSELSYAAHIGDGKVTVVTQTRAGRALLRQLGGRFSLFGGASCRLPYNSEIELASVLSALRDAGVAMAGGPSGWPPAAVFEELRSKGMLQGKFIEIAWRSPNETIETRK